MSWEGRAQSRLPPRGITLREGQVRAHAVLLPFGYALSGVQGAGTTATPLGPANIGHRQDCTTVLLPVAGIALW